MASSLMPAVSGNVPGAPSRTHLVCGAPDYENPAVLHVSKRPAHVPLRSHASLASASRSFLLEVRDQGYDGGQYLLSGVNWAFKLYRNPSEVPPDFMDPTFDREAHQWTTVSTTPCVRQKQQVPDVDDPTGDKRTLSWGPHGRRAADACQPDLTAECRCTFLQHACTPGLQVQPHKAVAAVHMQC